MKSERVTKFQIVEFIDADGSRWRVTKAVLDFTCYGDESTWGLERVVVAETKGKGG